MATFLLRLMRFLSQSDFYVILEETKPQDFVSSYILMLMSEPVKYTFTMLVIFVFLYINFSTRISADILLFFQ